MKMSVQPLPGMPGMSSYEQPAPVETARSKPVGPAVEAMFTQSLTHQVKKGLERYGTHLKTHNGRDAAIDAWQELVDLGQYLTQLQMEHADALAEVDRLQQRQRDMGEALGLLNSMVKSGESHSPRSTRAVEVAFRAQPEAFSLPAVREAFRKLLVAAVGVTDDSAPIYVGEMVRTDIVSISSDLIANLRVVVDEIRGLK